ncbi:MAG TPA: FAD-dependent oxidoreductase, partial [Candidatus Baltobacteraceae bacterium]|nr:FAD-dependent oxidoreductase [Candidatus Baltobacteraceae bacterium]
MIEVAVIGGGIIGTAIALALQKEGAAVCVFDPNEAGGGAAAGSAGYISVGEIFPLAHASLIAQLPHMLFDPLGPLVIRPWYVPHMSPWGIRFLAAMRPAAYARHTAALAHLNRGALDALEELARYAGAAGFIDHAGGLLVCEKPETLRSLERQLGELLAHGIDARLVGPHELRALEPSLSPSMAGAMFFAGSARCVDPAAFGAQLASAAAAYGTSFRRERVAR